VSLRFFSAASAFNQRNLPLVALCAVVVLAALQLRASHQHPMKGL
jgi:hypothetical protein